MLCARKRHHLGNQPVMSIAVNLWLLLARCTIGSCSSSRSSVRLVMECIPAILQCAAYKRMLQQAGGSSAEMSRYGVPSSQRSSLATWSLISRFTHERWGDTDDPSKMGKLRHPNNINQPLQQEAAREKTAKHLSDYANNRYISFLPAVLGPHRRGVPSPIVLPRSPRE